MRPLATFLLLALGAGAAPFLVAQTLPVPEASGNKSAPAAGKPAAPSPAPTVTPAPAKPTPATASNQALQNTIDKLTQSNRDLLDLLKKQQGVLEDMQFDRRLQSRQITSLVERLGEAQMENGKMQARIATLEAAAAYAAAHPAPAPSLPETTPQGGNTRATPSSTPPAETNVVEAPAPPPPATYLPPAPEGTAPAGTLAWQRLFTLSGSEAKTSDIFRIKGKTWRVVWHNQDKEGKAYKNTSALFINAFPKDDTIPQKACSQLGSGGGTTELSGPGNYYLKIEASGGSWELAVEDFR